MSDSPSRNMYDDAWTPITMCTIFSHELSMDDVTQILFYFQVSPKPSSLPLSGTSRKVSGSFGSHFAGRKEEQTSHLATRVLTEMSPGKMAATWLQISAPVHLVSSCISL